jgi:hypothetical protein
LNTLDDIRATFRSSPILRPLYLRIRRARAAAWSPFDTVYHCCTQKTASQWFKAVFRDPAFQRHTGLDVMPYVALGLREARFDAPFPQHCIATHLYVDYPTYHAIPKPDRYRTFSILRDPRDALVSWYFSMKYSHSARFDVVRELRRELTDLDVVAGIDHLIGRLDGFGFFAAQRSWVEGPVLDDPHVRVLRYEDFAADNVRFLAGLLDYLEVEMPAEVFRGLCERHAFRTCAGGREQGEEDVRAHFRKGVAGDWRNHFTPALEARLRETTGDLLAVLGYE